MVNTVVRSKYRSVENNKIEIFFNYIFGLTVQSPSSWMKIKKVEKFVENVHDKEEYVIHIRNLKQALKVH